MHFRALLLLSVLAICVQCLPVEPKFRQTALQAQESQTNVEIEAISARITFLEKLNKLTYDTTLFTRKLRWLLRRSLTEKPSVAEVAELMNKELAISKAQIDVAVEGVADELKLEVKQGIIALKAGLAFIEDNYKAGSDPEADAIIAKIKANLASLEARFGKKTGASASNTASVGTVASATNVPVIEPAQSTAPTSLVEQSTVAAAITPVASTTIAVPPVEQSTVAAPVVQATSAAAPPAVILSTGGSLIGSESEPSTVAPAVAPAAAATASAAATATASAAVTATASAAAAGSAPVAAAGSAPVAVVAAATGGAVQAPAATTAAPVPTVVLTSSALGQFNSTNSSAATSEAPLAESPLSASGNSASSFF